jgi:hypothetical protein
MAPLGQADNFKKYFDGLSKDNAKKSVFDFLKHLRHRYKNTGKPIRIYQIERDCSFMVLEDGSQWRLNLMFRSQQIYWSAGETVVVYAGRGGGWGVKLYDIKNPNDGDSAIWTFHGYVEGSSGQENAQQSGQR